MQTTISAHVAPAGAVTRGQRACRQPFTSLRPSRVLRRQQRPVCMAGADPSPPEGEQPTAPPAAPAPPSERPGLAKGQGTAIVTGAISIIFGVLYLALVQMMEMRGGELLPPPPEAFGP